AFGTQASIALENAGAFDRLALQARHDAALQEFGRRLLEATTETVVLGDAVNTAERLLHADAVALFLVNAGTRMRLAATLGWPPDAASTDTASAESFTEDVLAREETIEIEDSMPPYLEKHGMRPLIMVRLGAQDQPIGVLVCCSRAPRRFTDEEKRVFTSLARQLAVALDKVRLYAELRNNLQRLQETQAQLMQAD